MPINFANLIAWTEFSTFKKIRKFLCNLAHSASLRNRENRLRFVTLCYSLSYLCHRYTIWLDTKTSEDYGQDKGSG